MHNAQERINPFEPPQLVVEHGFDIRTTNFAATLTRIVVIPAGNLLGMLQLCAVLGIAFGTGHLPGNLGFMCALPGLASVMFFDLWWRSGQSEPDWLSRLLSPYAGGCLILLPVWLLFPLSGFIAAVW